MVGNIGSLFSQMYANKDMELDNLYDKELERINHEI